jgi:hypothetical protein
MSLALAAPSLPRIEPVLITDPWETVAELLPTRPPTSIVPVTVEAPSSLPPTIEAEDPLLPTRPPTWE